MIEVSFEVSADDLPHIETIVKRAASIYAKTNAAVFDRTSCRMDLMACHANGNPLDFERLASAEDFNLAHDVFGIARHIDRETGKLMDHFLPRFQRRDG